MRQAMRQAMTRAMTIALDADLVALIDHRITSGHSV